MTLSTIRQLDTAQLFQEVAGKIEEFLKANSQKPYLVIALPGGRSVVHLLTSLLPLLRNLEPQTRRKLQFFMIDERVVELNSPDSNYGMLHEKFFKVAVEQELLSSDQVHPFIFTPSSLSADLNAYFSKLEDFGGVFDVAVLGVGEDAHVAGLFPDHPSIQSQKFGFIAFENSPKPPPHRMSASLELILKSKLAIALFVGEAKRGAFDKFNRNEPIESCPVSLIRKIPTAFVVTDLKE